MQENKEYLHESSFKIEGKVFAIGDLHGNSKINFFFVFLFFFFK